MSHKKYQVDLDPDVAQIVNKIDAGGQNHAAGTFFNKERAISTKYMVWLEKETRLKSQFDDLDKMINDLPDDGDDDGDYQDVNDDANRKSSKEGQFYEFSETNTTRKQWKFNAWSNKSDGSVAKKPLSEYEGMMTISTFFSKYEQMKPEEMLGMLKKRKAQYFNLANYIKKEYAPVLPKAEKDKMLAKIEKELIPLLKKANEVIALVEQGNTEAGSHFLRRDFPEVTPDMLHQISLSERINKINEIKVGIEDAIADEGGYVQDLSGSVGASPNRNNNTHKKIQDGEKQIEKYMKLTDQMDELKSEPWIPLPLFTIAVETRAVNVYNSNIEPNILQVSFDCITNAPTKSYQVIYSFEVQKKVTQQYETQECDYSTQSWNYENKIEVAAKNTAPSTDLLTKSIHVELISNEGSCCFWSSKVRLQGNIPLEGLRDDNTVIGTLFMEPGQKRYGIKYALRLREAVQKTKRRKFRIVTIDKVFPALNINAKLPEPKEAANTQPNQQQPLPVPQQIQANAPSQQQQPIVTGLGFLVLTKAAEKEIVAVNKSEFPSGIPEQDILQPDNPSRNICFTFLQELSNQLELAKNALMGGFGNVSEGKAVREKWSLAYKEFMVLEGKLKNGDIEPEAYLASLTEMHQRDMKILEFYKANNLTLLVRFMVAKLESFNKEIIEMKEQLAS